MIVAFTGHRPNKLGGYNEKNPKALRVKFCIEDALLHLKPVLAISGMALGVDQWAAKICIGMGIPFDAAVPFDGQEKMWPEQSQKQYKSLIAHAHQIHFCSGPGYSAWKMQTRNEWMVNHCDVLIAVWDGTPGGTGNCVKYALQKQKPIYRINP